MKASITVTIHLRDHSDYDHPAPLPRGLTDAAIRDCMTRLVGIQEQGQLVLTTLYRVPGDVDSDSIQEVGGGMFVTGFSVTR